MSIGAEIIAIDDSDNVGWVESATTLGEVNFETTQQFVDNVESALGSRKMALLHIQVHGDPDGIGFGTDWVSMTTFNSFLALFTRLSTRFVSGAWVDLRACEVGQNLPLMHKFRTLWGVGLVAGRGYQNNIYDANLGFYQVVTPKGQEFRTFGVPPWVQYNSLRRGVRSVLSHL